MKIIIIISTLILSLSTSAQTLPNAVKLLKFSAAVDSVRLNSQLLSQGKKHGEVVEISVSGQLYNPPIKILNPLKDCSNKVKTIEFYCLYQRDLTSGNKNAVISKWSSDEQASKKALIDKHWEEIIDSNKSNSEIIVRGIIYQKTTDILLVGSKSVMGIPLKKSGNSYFMTDKPDNDLELAIVEATFK
jgi:hypothetical protein